MPGPHGYQVSEPGDPGFFFTDYNLWQRDRRVREFIESSNVPDVARSLVDSPGITLYFENVFVKAAGSRNIVPWHEDAMYMRMNGTVLNFWIARFPSTPPSSSSEARSIETPQGRWRFTSTERRRTRTP